jgi:putative two-component system response regulator
VLAVVDTFDSMTSDRPYRKALSLDEAITRLRASAGGQLDGALVARWIALVEAGVVLASERPHAMKAMRSEHA